MDIYTKQGNIIRHHPAADGTTEVELEFLFDDVLRSRLYAIAIYWLAFHERLAINYVLANQACTRAVVQQNDFDEVAQEQLVATMLLVRERASEVYATAEEFLYGKPASGNVDTNHLDVLRPYEKKKLDCKAFLEHLAVRLAV